MTKILNVRLKHAYKTEVEWKDSNSIPLDGEICISSDKHNFKIGDGVHSWTSLAYALDSSQLESAYQKTYDPTLSNTIDPTLLGVEYNPSSNTYQFQGTISLKVPRKSDYAVHLEISSWTTGGSGFISTPSIARSLSSEVDLVFHQATQLDITCTSLVNLSRIQVLEVNSDIIPTKLSQLDNDLNFMTSKVTDEILEIYKP